MTALGPVPWLGPCSSFLFAFLTLCMAGSLCSLSSKCFSIIPFLVFPYLAFTASVAAEEGSTGSVLSRYQEGSQPEKGCQILTGCHSSSGHTKHQERKIRSTDETTIIWGQPTNPRHKSATLSSFPCPFPVWPTRLSSLTCLLPSHTGLLSVPLTHWACSQHRPLVLAVPSTCNALHVASSFFSPGLWQLSP